MSYIPQAGDVGIHGTMLVIFSAPAFRWVFGGIVLADGVQGEPGSQWAAKSDGHDPNWVPDNPLRFQVDSSADVRDFSSGDRVVFDVMQGRYALAATNVRAEA